MNLGIKGKKALVTGGATGIGRAIVCDLAKEGVKVFFTSRNQENSDETLKIIGGEKSGHRCLVCDATQQGMPQKLASKVKKDFGNIDIVVNNVGGTLGVKDPYCAIGRWRKVFRLNFELAVEINNEFLPHMKKQDWGRIVNITAGAGLENSGPVTYCCSKAAMTAYTRSMGRILAIETRNYSAVPARHQ